MRVAAATVYAYLGEVLKGPSLPTSPQGGNIMRNFSFGVLMLFAVSFVGSVTPQDAVAQFCARCDRCNDCDKSKWGGMHCTFVSGCCNEGGGNCNPAKAVDTAPGDQFVVDIDGQEVLTVRLAGNIFGTWACEDGLLSVAYATDGEGNAKPVSETEMARLRGRFTFEEYVLNYRGKQSDDQG